MSATRSCAVLVPLSTVIAAIAIALPTPAGADDNPCSYGYTPRLARPGDDVCVSYTVKARVQEENANPTRNRQPGGGAYGPDTCANGFVWREAFDGDTICVTPDERASTKADNAAAQSRLKANVRTIEYDVYGAGSVISIDVTGHKRLNNVSLPWAGGSFSKPVGEPAPLTVTVIGDEYATAGCRIKVNGTVVDQQPVINGMARCNYAG